jgi:CHAD domain-containing protein
VICVLEQVRQVRNVASASPSRKSEDAPVLMQLYLDEVCIRSSPAEAVLARAYEVEVELFPEVDLAELQVLADRLIGVYDLKPSSESKLERALRIISRHPVNSPESWQGIAPDLHMGEACRIIWHEQFMAMLLNEAGVRYSSDPEYVHAARVAIRRARAAARLYRAYFKGKDVRRFLKQMRKTAQLLGAVRDLDVATGKLFGYQQKSRKKSAGDLQGTLDEWMTRRASAHQELVAWFDSAAYAQFVTDFLQFCRTPGAGLVDMTPAAGEEVIPCQVRHVAPAMLLSNFAHVRAYETWFEQEDEPPLPTLHRLRIECKYLRYNLEFVSSLLGPASVELIAWLKELQDDLGDLNDAAVSKQLLANGDNGGNGAVLTRYESAQDKTIAKLRSQTHADFTRFVGSENRRRLLDAIANL